MAKKGSQEVSGFSGRTLGRMIKGRSSSVAKGGAQLQATRSKKGKK